MGLQCSEKTHRESACIAIFLSAYAFGAPKVAPSFFNAIHVAQPLVFYVAFCVLLFVCWSFFFSMLAMFLSVYY